VLNHHSNEVNLSPFYSAALRSDELVRLRTEKPQPGERRTVGSISIPPSKEPFSFEPVTSPIGSEKKEKVGPEKEEAVPETDSEPKKDSAEVEESKADENAPYETSNKIQMGDEVEGTDNAPEKDAESDKNEGPAGDEAADDDSEEAVGKEEAAQLDQDLMNDDDIEKEVKRHEDHHAGSVSGMIQKLLHMKGSSGHVVVSVGQSKFHRFTCGAEPLHLNGF
jgi:hypothetical protein